MSCSYTNRLDEPYRTQCQASIEAAVQSLDRWRDQLAPPEMAKVKINEQQTCIDTFIPGREAADCEFYFLEAVIPLHWLQ